MSTDPSPAAALRERFAAAVTTAEDPGWDQARLAFNLLVDQRPTAVATPASAAETAEIVAAARELGLRIAPQGSAHNARPLGDLDDTLLLRFGRMTAVELDPDARSARVEAGARWWDVVPAASELGLSALHGSSPEVDVVGYSLGGGIGWQARKHGLQANRITAIDVVTADGAERRVDAANEPDLFWGLRGAAGNFGAVTAIEFELLPLSELYAGTLFFGFDRAGEVLQAWRAWAESAPEEVTSCGRLLQLPDLELMPEVVRGQSFTVIEVAFLGGEEEGRELLAPLRELGPQMDTLAMVPPAALAELHMDPVDPVPYLSAHALLGELPEQGIDELVAAAGPGSGSTLLSVEVRHGGGALAREAPGGGAVTSLPGSFVMFGVGALMAPEMLAPLEASLEKLGGALAPHQVGRYVSFTEQAHDVAEIFEAATLERLRSLKAQYDPDGVFRANHAV